MLRTCILGPRATTFCVCVCWHTCLSCFRRHDFTLRVYWGLDGLVLFYSYFLAIRQRACGIYWVSKIHGREGWATGRNWKRCCISLRGFCFPIFSAVVVSFVLLLSSRLRLQEREERGKNTGVWQAFAGSFDKGESDNKKTRMSLMLFSFANDGAV